MGKIELDPIIFNIVFCIYCRIVSVPQETEEKTREEEFEEYLEDLLL